MLNIRGEVEMDALVMDGNTLGSGAVSAVRNVANPIQLARLVMDKVCQGCKILKTHQIYKWCVQPHVFKC